MASFNSVKIKKGQLDLEGPGVAVANLPSPAGLGMIRVVNDATSPAAGSAPTGGGSAKALCWYNGTAWRVMGI